MVVSHLPYNTSDLELKGFGKIQFSPFGKRKFCYKKLKNALNAGFLKQEHERFFAMH